MPNRWVRAGAAKTLGEQPPLRHFGPSPIGANTNVIQHAGKTIALIEAGVSAYELTDELDTIGVYDFEGTQTGGTAVTRSETRQPVSCTQFRIAYIAGIGSSTR